MILCVCGNKVKTKFCGKCGNKCNGDSDILKWVSECETNMKYWFDKRAKIPTDGTGDVKDGKQCKAKIDMWTKRVQILKQIAAEINGQESE